MSAKKPLILSITPNVMRKCLLFLIFALVAGLAANAAPVSAKSAGCRAAAFLHKDARQLQQLTSPYEYLYLFAFEEGGFAVVSADDRVQPILGYSDKGVLSVEGMPPALAAWLADCDSVVRVAAGDNSLLMHLGWLEQGASKGPEGFDSIVGPLLLTTWDQSLPTTTLALNISVNGRLRAAWPLQWLS